jgi:hypothetical protein
MIVCLLNWFNSLYIYYLELNSVFVKGYAGSQSPCTCIRGQHASTLKYDRSVESQHGQCKEEMSPTESLSLEGHEFVFLAVQHTRINST